MKYLFAFAMMTLCSVAAAAGNCRLSTLDGTWEYLGSTENNSRLAGGVTLSTAQGRLQIRNGIIVSGELSQYFILADGSVSVMPATVQGGVMNFDSTTCRLAAQINAGVTLRGMNVDASYIGRGEYSRIARAIVGRSRSRLNGSWNTFMLRPLQ